MTLAALDTCRSCSRPITWMVTPKNRRMPLDLEPAESGNVRVLGDVAYTLRAEELENARSQGERLYVSHFATCPNARQHRGVPRDG